MTAWACVAAAGSLFLFAGCEPAGSADDPARAGADVEAQAPGTQRVTIGDRTFTLELALDDDTRFQGLSDRAYLAPDGGMLFVFPQPRNLEFVMRRCLVPIDILFLDPAGRVTATHAMAVEPYDRPEPQLRRYSSQYRAQFAIELSGGTLKTLDLQPGQAIDLPLEDLKTRAK